MVEHSCQALNSKNVGVWGGVGGCSSSPPPQPPPTLGSGGGPNLTVFQATAAILLYLVSWLSRGTNHEATLVFFSFNRLPHKLELSSTNCLTGLNLVQQTDSQD